MERNILPGGSSHPALHAGLLSLGRAKVEDALNRKIQTRPTKSEVVQRNIMRGGASALVAEKQQALSSIYLRRQLEAHIESRPGPLDLLHSSIIEPPHNIDVSSWVKREWSPPFTTGSRPNSAGTRGQPETSVQSTNAPPPPPLPVTSPTASRSGSGDAGNMFTFDGVGSSTQTADASELGLRSPPSRHPSLYSIVAPDGGMQWGGSGGGDGGSSTGYSSGPMMFARPRSDDSVGLDFDLPDMELEWPGTDFPVEHKHIVEEQLKNIVREVVHLLPMLSRV